MAQVLWGRYNLTTHIHERKYLEKQPTSGKWTFNLLIMGATKKTLTTFHYTGCLIGILIMVYYNAYVTGEYNALYTSTNQVFFHCSWEFTGPTMKMPAPKITPKSLRGSENYWIVPQTSLLHHKTLVPWKLTACPCKLMRIRCLICWNICMISSMYVMVNIPYILGFYGNVTLLYCHISTLK